MDYKEKYNKLVEAVKVLQETNPSDKGIQNWVNDNVPELKESEDEKIRKRIIQAIKIREKEMNEEWSDEIAWLEKQKQNPAWTEEDRAMAFTLMRDIDQVSFISKEGKNERIGCLNSLDEKFASTESAWSEEDEEMYQNIHECLKNGWRKLPTDLLKYESWIKSLEQRMKGE